MMSNGDRGNDVEDVFGCDRCWPADADSAWDAKGHLARETTLIAESHFSVRILACPECRQRFVSVFTEEIDWEDGDDPQHFTSLPIHDDEAAVLVREGSDALEARLAHIGPNRRSLRHDWPKGVPAAASSWGRGVSVGPHD